MNNPIARILLNNIKHNANQIKKQSNNANILAIIKADAYGHGAERVAQFLDTDNNINGFGVSRFTEALELFDNKIKKPILLLEGVSNDDQLEFSSNNNLCLVIQNIEQLKQIEQIAINRIKQPLSVWLKFDTGMNRLGMNCADINNIIELLNDLIKLKKVNSDYVIMSHFACADDVNNKYNLLQLDSFKNLVSHQFNDNIPEYSIANSAGIFGWPDSHYDWVRPGVSLYGSSPLLDKSSDELNLKASMELLSTVIITRVMKKGQSIGYGATWQASKDSLIAILACGYADCYPRLITNNYAYIENTMCPIVGRVSMDMLAIDCSMVPDGLNQIKSGDQAELWGNNISIDSVAKACNTISNDLYCRITARVDKEYV